MDAEEALAWAMTHRPEFDVLRAERRLVQVELAVARNSAIPSVDASVIASSDIGGGDPDAIRRLSDPVVAVGVTLSSPIPARRARGAISDARARAAQLEAMTRRIREMLVAEQRALLRKPVPRMKPGAWRGKERMSPSVSQHENVAVSMPVKQRCWR